MTWEERVQRGLRDHGVNLNELAKERDRLKKEGGDSNRLSEIQNQINKMSGSDVSHKTDEGYEAQGMSDFYGDYDATENVDLEKTIAAEKGEEFDENIERVANENAAGGEGGEEGDSVEQALSRRELRQQGRRDRKQTRMDNLQRKIDNMTGSTGSEDDLKQARLSRRHKRLEGRRDNVGEGARKFREKRDNVMKSIRDGKAGEFFKGWRQA